MGGSAAKRSSRPRWRSAQPTSVSELGARTAPDGERSPTVGVRRARSNEQRNQNTGVVIRQGFACVWVRATSADEAVATAAERLGHMGGWKVGPDVGQEVFRADEYREHAQPGDYTRSVIFAPRSA